jgi:hypothetical protein
MSVPTLTRQGYIDFILRECQWFDKKSRGCLSTYCRLLHAKVVQNADMCCIDLDTMSDEQLRGVYHMVTGLKILLDLSKEYFKPTGQTRIIRAEDPVSV